MPSFRQVRSAWIHQQDRSAAGLAACLGGEDYLLGSGYEAQRGSESPIAVIRRLERCTTIPDKESGATRCVSNYSEDLQSRVTSLRWSETTCRLLALLECFSDCVTDLCRHGQLGKPGAAPISYIVQVDRSACARPLPRHSQQENRSFRQNGPYSPPTLRFSRLKGMSDTLAGEEAKSRDLVAAEFLERCSLRIEGRRMRKRKRRIDRVAKPPDELSQAYRRVGAFRCRPSGSGPRCPSASKHYFSVHEWPVGRREHFAVCIHYPRRLTGWKGDGPQKCQVNLSKTSVIAIAGERTGASKVRKGIPAL